VPRWHGLILRRAFAHDAAQLVYMMYPGDDVQRKELKLCIAFKRLKNFATVVPQKGRLLPYLDLDVDKIAPPAGVGPDVQNQGHWGTGDMELLLTKVARP
jgi:predicted transport protein